MHICPPLTCLSSILVVAKFNLPGSASLILKDSSDVEVDSDIFDELLKSSEVSFKAEECNGEELQAYIVHFFPECCSINGLVNGILQWQIWILSSDWLVNVVNSSTAVTAFSVLMRTSHLIQCMRLVLHFATSLGVVNWAVTPILSWSIA